jgi:hypothetical protein
VWGNSRCSLREPTDCHTDTVCGSPYLTGDTQIQCGAVRTSQETHRYTVWAVRTSQETYHVSATEPNRLMLCGETVAVCCENRTEHADTLCEQSIPHRRHTDTLRGQNEECCYVKARGVYCNIGTSPGNGSTSYLCTLSELCMRVAAPRAHVTVTSCTCKWTTRMIHWYPMLLSGDWTKELWKCSKQ